MHALWVLHSVQRAACIYTVSRESIEFWPYMNIWHVRTITMFYYQSITGHNIPQPTGHVPVGTWALAWNINFIRLHIHWPLEIWYNSSYPEVGTAWDTRYIHWHHHWIRVDIMSASSHTLMGYYFTVRQKIIIADLSATANGILTTPNHWSMAWQSPLDNNWTNLQ